MFRATTGQTPHRYLMELRLNKAHDMIADGSTPLSYHFHSWLNRAEVGVGGWPWLGFSLEARCDSLVSSDSEEPDAQMHQ